MIMDTRTQFADAVSVANVAATINVGDTIDIGVLRDIGGSPYLVISVDTSIITGGTAGTIQFLLVSDSTAVPSTDGSATTHYASKLFVTDDDALNELDAGEYAVVIQLPIEGVAYERYLGIQAVIATTTTTAGKINAFLTLDPPQWQAYPEASN